MHIVIYVAHTKSLCIPLKQARKPVGLMQTLEVNKKRVALIEGNGQCIVFHFEQ